MPACCHSTSLRRPHFTVAPGVPGDHGASPCHHRKYKQWNVDSMFFPRIFPACLRELARDNITGYRIRVVWRKLAALRRQRKASQTPHTWRNVCLDLFRVLQPAHGRRLAKRSAGWWHLRSLGPWQSSSPAAPNRPCCPVSNPLGRNPWW